MKRRVKPEKKLLGVGQICMHMTRLFGAKGKRIERRRKTGFEGEVAYLGLLIHSTSLLVVNGTHVICFSLISCDFICCIIQRRKADMRESKGALSMRVCTMNNDKQQLLYEAGSQCEYEMKEMKRALAKQPDKEGHSHDVATNQTRITSF